MKTLIQQIRDARQREREAIVAADRDRLTHAHRQPTRAELSEVAAASAALDHLLAKLGIDEQPHNNRVIDDSLERVAAAVGLKADAPAEHIVKRVVETAEQCKEAFVMLQRLGSRLQLLAGSRLLEEIPRAVDGLLELVTIPLPDETERQIRETQRHLEEVAAANEGEGFRHAPQVFHAMCSFSRSMLAIVNTVRKYLDLPEGAIMPDRLVARLERLCDKEEERTHGADVNVIGELFAIVDDMENVGETLERAKIEVGCMIATWASELEALLRKLKPHPGHKHPAVDIVIEEKPR